MGIEDNIANLMDYFESVVVFSLSGERETTYTESVQIQFSSIYELMLFNQISELKVSVYCLN